MIVTSYLFLDASTEEYQEEEVYCQEEEDHFDQYTNQGKLIFVQKCKALPEQGTITYYFLFHDPSQVLSWKAFTLIYLSLLL